MTRPRQDDTCGTESVTTNNGQPGARLPAHPYSIYMEAACGVQKYYYSMGSRSGLLQVLLQVQVLVHCTVQYDKKVDLGPGRGGTATADHIGDPSTDKKWTTLAAAAALYKH